MGWECEEFNGLALEIVVKFLSLGSQYNSRAFGILGKLMMNRGWFLLLLY